MSMRRFMGPPVRWSGMAVAGLVAAALLGCDQSVVEEENAGTSPGVSFKISALKSACGTSNPVADADQFRICGEAPIQLAEGGSAVRRLFDATVGPQGSVVIDDIRANDLYDITAVALSKGKPVYIGRAKNVSVRVDATTNLSLTLAPYNKAACIDLKKVGSPNHRVFPASVLLSDGRVFVSGGFAGLANDGGTPVLTAASDKTYFFDPKDGSVTEGPTLKQGRAAHAAVYVSTQQKIILIGGSTRMPFSDNTDKFGLQYDAQTALNSIEIIDVEGAAPVISEAPIEMELKRVFPQVAAVGTSELVITGGGAWPESNADYKRAEIFDAANDTLSESVVTDFTPRALHTLTYVKKETVETASVDVYLAWGGTPTDAKAAFLVNTRGQAQSQPSFVSAVFTGDSAAFERTYFHTMTPLDGDRFLAIGGVGLDGNKLSKLDASAAYLISYEKKDGQRQLKVEALGGLPEGRWGHSATSHDGSTASILGGFTSLAGGGTATVATFDLAKKAFSTSPQPPAFAPRGGQAATLLQGDALYLAGGIEQKSDLQLPEIMLSEVFVPTSVDFCTAPVPAEGEEEQ